MNKSAASFRFETEAQPEPCSHEQQSAACAVCGADVRPIPHIRWGTDAWCYDCVTIVRAGGRTTVQARF